MLSREEIRRQINLRIFGSPATLLPLLGGGAALVSPLLFSVAPAIPVFVGISGLVAAGGNVLIQSLISREKIIREILAEAEADNKHAQESALNALQGSLAADGDARTHKLLADLRALVAAIHGGDWQGKLNAAATADILRGVDELFSATVRRLERTTELTTMIRKIDTPAAKKNLITERERIVDEVIDSVAQLSGFVAKLNSVSLNTQSEERLDSIVAGLERDLGIAQSSAQLTDDLTVTTKQELSSDHDNEATRDRNDDLEIDR